MTRTCRPRSSARPQPWLAASVALWLGACALPGLGPAPGEEAAEEADAPPPLPDVSDAEVFLGQPGARSAATGGGTSAGKNTTRTVLGGSSSGALLGGGGQGGAIASTGTRGAPCEVDGIQPVEVTVTELDTPNLEEQIFGTTGAQSVVKDAPDPCARPQLVVPKPLLRH